ncbi:MAG: PAS domain-containing protein, partial [Roseinatronobacter sp.]
LFSPTARDALSVCLDQLCRTPSTMILSLVSEQAMGKPKLTARMLLLPLRSEEGAINRVLGCLDSNGLIGVAPRRFTIAACHTTTLEGDDLTERDAAAAPRYAPEPQASPQKAAVQGARFGFSESASPFAGQNFTGQTISGQRNSGHPPNAQTPADGTPASAFRHLRLVTSET